MGPGVAYDVCRSAINSIYKSPLYARHFAPCELHHVPEKSTWGDFCVKAPTLKRYWYELLSGTTILTCPGPSISWTAATAAAAS